MQANVNHHDLRQRERSRVCQGRATARGRPATTQARGRTSPPNTAALGRYKKGQAPGRPRSCSTSARGRITCLSLENESRGLENKDLLARERARLDWIPQNLLVSLCEFVWVACACGRRAFLSILARISESFLTLCRIVQPRFLTERADIRLSAAGMCTTVYLRRRAFRGTKMPTLQARQNEPTLFVRATQRVRE